MTNKYLITLFTTIILTSCTMHSKRYGEIVSVTDKSNIGFMTESSMIIPSIEKATFSSNNLESLDEVIKLSDGGINPIKVEISCKESELNCIRIENILKARSIPVERTLGNESGVNDITLVYKKSVIRNCYEDLSTLMPNTPDAVIYPTFGCAVTQNILEMISDHNQLSNPVLSGLQDAGKAIKAVKKSN